MAVSYSKRASFSRQGTPYRMFPAQVEDSGDMAQDWEKLYGNATSLYIQAMLPLHYQQKGGNHHLKQVHRHKRNPHMWSRRHSEDKIKVPGWKKVTLKGWALVPWTLKSAPFTSVLIRNTLSWAKLAQSLMLKRYQGMQDLTRMCCCSFHSPHTLTWRWNGEKSPIMRNLWTSAISIFNPRNRCYTTMGWTGLQFICYTFK